MAEPSLHTRERIARLAEDALRRADVVDVLPTPLAAVQAAVGIEERIDISELPAAVRAKAPAAFSRVLGALLPDQRVVFIDRGQVPVRQTWTNGHEAAHAMCGWHGEILRLDNESTLFRELYPGVEAEANYGAGQLIFQGGRFHRRALREQVSIATPIALSEEYGASIHATVHYYAEEHPSAVALAILGVRHRADGRLPVWRCIESPNFRRRFASFLTILPDGAPRLSAGGVPSTVGELLLRSRCETIPPSTTVGLPDFGGTQRKFVLEAFFNGRCHFLMASERRATRFGRRVRLEAPQPALLSAR
ncbi:MAG TPA: ImmA/IrrE family metallo-endopeptidase [Solirubrobacterales bacterium]